MMYAKTDVSIYDCYTPLTKKHQKDDVEAYLSAILAKELYSEFDRLANHMLLGVMQGILKQEGEKHG